MGTLLYPSELLAQKEIDKWWQTNTTITTREFRNLLQNTYPDYDWSWLWCSKYLIDHTHSSYKIEDITYYLKQNSLLGVFNSSVDLLKKLKTPVTKKAIKCVLQHFQITYTVEDFEQCMSTLTPTGEHTTENHKTYI